MTDHDHPIALDHTPWHDGKNIRTGRTRGQTLPRSRRTTSVRLIALAALTVVAVTATACSSDTTEPTAAAASSSNSSMLPTPPGVAKDSIEDINSTKDMTGVVTTYSDADNPKNPYFDLIPYVCPFLPDSLTREQFRMTNKSTGFGGQHSLLQTCNMSGPIETGGRQLSVVVSLQATSFADVNGSKTHTNVARNVPIWRNVSGTLYRNAGDDRPTVQSCNLVWGTFYGTAVVTATARSGYPVDPCDKAREWAPLIAPYLPSKPAQMRPTEG